MAFKIFEQYQLLIKATAPSLGSILLQKEWMKNVHKRPETKVQVFGTCF
jgi:hypothetical protein